MPNDTFSLSTGDGRLKLVLIDRDGVINEELPNYVKSPEELLVYRAALEGIALLTKSGFTCVVVTNQSVVGRGIIDGAVLSRIHAKLKDQAYVAGGLIHDVIVCTDTPEAASYRRKPAPGMLLEALKRYECAPEATPYIGDALTDMQAALAAGCPRYLVMTGKGKKTWGTLPQEVKPVTACTDLLDAARKIINT
jgi:D-glycero-D-manno-heptose 1,7-bisphosphate phosphatase